MAWKRLYQLSMASFKFLSSAKRLGNGDLLVAGARVPQVKGGKVSTVADMALVDRGGKVRVNQIREELVELAEDDRM